jgi:lipopolysaccharide transport system permease protein
MSQSAVTVYEATSRPQGLAAWAALPRDLARSRELIWRLFVRDISTKYKQSIFGYVWAVGPPLATVAVFAFLARNRIIAVGDTGIPYPAYVLLGLAVWGLFAGGVTSTTSSLTAASNVLQKMDFPRESLVVAAIGQTLVDTLIRSFLVAAVFLWYGVSVRWTALLVPLVLVPLVLLTLGVGFILSVFNALARDVSSAIALALQFGIFLAPVVYPPRTTWPELLINYLNPVSPFVVATHDLVSRGGVTMPAPLAVASLLGVLVFLFGWRLFRLAQPIIGERI